MEYDFQQFTHVNKLNKHSIEMNLKYNEINFENDVAIQSDLLQRGFRAT